MLSIVYVFEQKSKLLNMGIYTLLRNYKKKCEFIFVEKFVKERKKKEIENVNNIIYNLSDKGHKIKHILINTKKYDKEVLFKKTYSHCLNVGVKNTTNKYIVKTNPEILHCYNTLGYFEKELTNNIIIFGNILYSDYDFREKIDKGIFNYKTPVSLVVESGLYKQHNVKGYKNLQFHLFGFDKDIFLNCGGIHEEFMKGFNYDDYDFYDVLRINNINIKITDKILGICLNDEKESYDYNKLEHIKINNKNEKLLKIRKEMRKKLDKKYMVSNYGYNWGDMSLVENIFEYNY